MVLPPLTFIVEPTMNLMSGTTLSVRGKSTIHRALEVPKDYSQKAGPKQILNV